MSPIPRCDLRLPTMDCKKSRVVDANALKVVSKHSSMPKEVKRTASAKKTSKRRQADDATTPAPSQAETEATTAAATTNTNPTEAVVADGTTEAAATDDAAGTTTAPDTGATVETTETAETTETTEAAATEAPTDGPTTKPPKRTPVGCLPETPAPEVELTQDECKTTVAPEVDPNAVPPGRVRVTRDTEETIKIKDQIKAGELPRDTADSIHQSSKMQKMAFGEEEHPVCTTGEEEALVEKQEWASCPGTPGDTTYDWLQFERPESPGDVTMPKPPKLEDLSHLTQTQLEERMCKRRHKRQKYIKMWGNEDALRRFTRHKLEARRKRKQLEKMHAQNTWMREKMRNHARKKRRMYRCKDQSKIPSLNEDIQINKAFYFRFNYNNQVPCMPSDMDKHFTQFKKPPFKNGAVLSCVKAVDEFEKLRVQKKSHS